MRTWIWIIPIYKIWLDILVHIYILVYIYNISVLYHCFWSPSFPINSSPSNMATVVAQVIVQATGNALTKAVTAAEVRLLKRLRWRSPWQKQRPIVGGSGKPKFHYYADKQMIETNKSSNSWGTKGAYNSPDWFLGSKQDPYHHGVGIWGRDCHSGIATGHQAPFQGPASNHRAEDGGLWRGDMWWW